MSARKTKPTGYSPSDKIEHVTASGAFSSYSGADIRLLLAMPAAGFIEPIFVELATVQTLSYSLFREKIPVRSLGFIGERGVTRGSRTIAGSMVNTVFDRHALYDVLRPHPGDPARNSVSPSGYVDLAHTMVDQLPPFDIVIQFANEYGHVSEMVIFGVDISAEGQVMSIEDMITENTMQYRASHLAVMRPGGHREAILSVDSEGNPMEYGRETFQSIMSSQKSEEMKELIAMTFNPFR